MCYTPILLLFLAFRNGKNSRDVEWKHETQGFDSWPDQTSVKYKYSDAVDKKISRRHPLDLRIERMIAAYLWDVGFEDLVQRKKSQRKYTIPNGGIKQLQLPFSFKLMSYTEPKGFHGAEGPADIFFSSINETVDQWIWESIAGRQLEFRDLDLLVSFETEQKAFLHCLVFLFYSES